MERRRDVAPVREGDEIDVRIEAVGEKGDGIAKVNGFVLFVPNTKEGDSVRVRVARVVRKVGFADVIGTTSSKAKAREPEDEDEPKDTDDFGDEPEETEEESDKDDEDDEERG